MIKRIASIILASLLCVHALAAVITRNPTANQTPDPGQGGSAVTGNINTGHGSTTASQTGVGSTTKSCNWTGFQAVSGQIKSVTLKLDWTENGDLPDGSNSFRIQYSVDGGSNWTDIINHSNIVAANSSSSQVTLSNTQDLTLVQVRDRLVAATTTGTNSVTASVSTIRIEVVTVDPHVIVMME